MDTYTLSSLLLSGVLMGWEVGKGGNRCLVFMNCRQYTDTDGDVWTLTLSLQLLSGVLSGWGRRLEGNFSDSCLVHMDCGQCVLMEMCGRQSIVIAAIVRCVVGVGVDVQLLSAFQRGEVRCDKIRCPPTDCEHPYTPRGHCCPVCQGQSSSSKSLVRI